VDQGFQWDSPSLFKNIPPKILNFKTFFLENVLNIRLSRLSKAETGTCPAF
jgi:hypothetical protein